MEKSISKQPSKDLLYGGNGDFTRSALLGPVTGLCTLKLNGASFLMAGTNSDAFNLT